MQSISINCSTEENILILSDLCMAGKISSGAECVQNLDSTTKAIRYVTGSWYIIVAVLGILGNLATLFSIPFATRRKQYGFDKNVETTIFILNLSCIDLCYCLLYALPQSTSYIFNYWLFNVRFCKACYTLGNILYGADMLAVAFIAISRCLELTKNGLWMKWSEKKFVLYTVVFSTWLCGILEELVGWLFVVFESNGRTGWDCQLGLCELIMR